MTDKKTVKFSDFIKENPLNENLIPAHAITPDVEDELEDVERKYPVLFATIHHQSEDRPDGYTPDELFWMNHDANHHMPDLQKSMREQRRAEGHDDVKDESEYT